MAKKQATKKVQKKPIVEEETIEEEEFSKEEIEKLKNATKKGVTNFREIVEDNGKDKEEDVDDEDWEDDIEEIDEDEEIETDTKALLLDEKKKKLKAEMHHDFEDDVRFNRKLSEDEIEQKNKDVMDKWRKSVKDKKGKTPEKRIKRIMFKIGMFFTIKSPLFKFLLFLVKFFDFGVNFITAFGVMLGTASSIYYLIVGNWVMTASSCLVIVVSGYINEKIK